MDLELLGKRIKLSRKKQGLTLETLAEHIGISRNFLWEIEAGRKIPSLNTLYSISTMLNVSTDYLMGITEVNNHSDNAAITEYDNQLVSIIRRLDSFGKKELSLISDLLDGIIKYVEKK